MSSTAIIDPDRAARHRGALLRTPVFHWILRLVIALPLTVAFQVRISNLLPFTGDEPRYVLAAHSAVRDGDFDLLNNYRNKDYLQFGFVEGDMVPPFYRPGMDKVPAEHGIGFPLVIAPAYASGGTARVRSFLIAISIATILFVGLACDLLGLPLMAGSLATAFLTLSPSWQIQASRVYPENFAGFVFVLVLIGLTLASRQRNSRFQLAVLTSTGALLVLLPFLYAKYVAVCGPLLLAALCLQELRRPGLYLGILAGLIVGFGVNLAFGTGLSPVGAALTQPSLFGISISLQSFWPSLLDRWHGLVTWQPLTLLTFWSIPSRSLRWDRLRYTLKPWVAVAILGFWGMLAVWKSSPGWSLPGRYQCSVLPLMCIAISVWLFQPDRFRVFRSLVVATLCFIGGYYVVTATTNHVTPYHVALPLPLFGLQEYRDLFAYYWSGMEAGEVTSVGFAGLVVLVLIAVSKSVAWLADSESRRRQTAAFVMLATAAGWAAVWGIAGTREHLVTSLTKPLKNFDQDLQTRIGPLTLAPGERATIPVTLRNPGPETWVSSGLFPVLLSYSWTQNDKPVLLEGLRTGLPVPVRPGREISVDLNLQAPLQPGLYELRVTLVQEGVSWFHHASGRYLRLQATVKDPQ